MFRTKARPTATPREHARDFPAGHDDPQSPFYIPPGLRPYYRDADEPDPDLLARSRKTLSYELAEQEAAAAQRPVAERQIIAAESEPDANPTLAGQLRRQWFDEDGRFRPRHAPEKGYTIDYNRGLITPDEEARAHHMALLDRCNHKAREEHRARQFVARATCGNCEERDDPRSLKPMVDVARVCRKCHAVAELQRAMAWQHDELPNGQTRGDVVAAVVARHSGSGPLSAFAAPVATPAERQS